MNVPERIDSPPEPGRRGSLALGFGLAWLTMIACYAALFVGLDALHGASSFLSIFAMPWIAAILLIIWLVATRRTRTALGVAIGLATVLVVCAGLFMLIASELSRHLH